MILFNFSQGCSVGRCQGQSGPRSDCIIVSLEKLSELVYPYVKYRMEADAWWNAVPVAIIVLYSVFRELQSPVGDSLSQLVRDSTPHGRSWSPAIRSQQRLNARRRTTVGAQRNAKSPLKHVGTSTSSLLSGSAHHEKLDGEHSSNVWPCNREWFWPGSSDGCLF